MRAIFAAACFAALSSLPAAAQTQPNPIVEHYRAYVAALDSGDLAAAATAAEQALAASEARDGDGGRTAVLALNLATARLMSGDGAGALAPAQRALSLSQAGADGVDPLFAELVVGRAELAARGRAGADRIERILRDPRIGALPPLEVHAAAVDLGAWALRERAYARSEAAWEIAVASAQGSPYGEAFGRGRALTWRAASIVLDEVGRSGGQRMDRDRAAEAYRLLIDAQTALRPLADLETPTLELTIAQRTYAEARAWYSVIRAKMRADNQDLPDYGEPQGDADGYSELGPVDLQRPRCLVRLNVDPRPQYPRDALRRGHLAGLVLRLRLNDAGEIVENQTVARIGDESFSEAAERVAQRWTVTKRSDSAPNCRMASTLLVPITFTIAPN